MCTRIKFDTILDRFGTIRLYDPCLIDDTSRIPTLKAMRGDIVCSSYRRCYRYLSHLISVKNYPSIARPDHACSTTKVYLLIFFCGRPPICAARTVVLARSGPKRSKISNRLPFASLYEMKKCSIS